MPNFKSIFLFIFCFSHYSVQAVTHSNLKSDEHLVFFQTSAWYDPATAQWHVPVHGWVFEPADSVVRKKVIAKSLYSLFGLEVSASTQNNFNDRINAILADNERNKSIIIRFADRSYQLPRSQANGHFKKVIQIDSQHIDDSKQQLEFVAVLSGHDKRKFHGSVNLVKPAGLSIISDIDDTIKISEVTNRKQLMMHTFFNDFKAVSGMANRYRQWLKSSSGLHFVSSSPWQLYPFLSEFTKQAGFPDASFNLKLVRFKDSSLINLFQGGMDTKMQQIKTILNNYPQHQFILVGDSGEQDPEVYSRIYQQYSTQIVAILIRNVTQESLDNQRFKALTTTTKVWQLFKHAQDIKPLSGLSLVEN